MATTAAQKKASAKWQAQNRDRLSIIMPLGTRDEIKTAAAAAGEKSVNAYILGAIRARMSGGAPAQAPDVSADTLELAAAAAAAAGEDVPAFLARAIRQTADADERTRRLAQAAPARSTPRETVPAERLEDQIQQRVERLRALRGTSEPISDPADATAADKKAAQDAPKAP